MDTIADIIELENEAARIRARLDGGMFPNLYLTDLIRLAGIETKRTEFYNLVRANAANSIAAE